MTDAEEKCDVTVRACAFAPIRQGVLDAIVKARERSHLCRNTADPGFVVGLCGFSPIRVSTRSKLASVGRDIFFIQPLSLPRFPAALTLKVLVTSHPSGRLPAQLVAVVSSPGTTAYRNQSPIARPEA
ncbi:uncharacterized protein MCYG_05580 [Microsporum canis CBS 113480]|uniref:Uncharacterized protein n=1 Tax=Arthroderma otae (strain ATCC MYA-4605 / CBS 113480) TaxID=554155 RepID=C5FSA8_ARTOC|nr:uncharacterized protein MCYG_05580 [Microsporum canis CBS 113480]EEQ32761.1 predicted protein [Microsporum canis CBS 113480]